MSNKIVVDPIKLELAATAVEQQAADYARLYKQLYTEVDSMSAAWQGADNQAYVAKIKGFMDDFEQMNKLMLQYSEFLKISAATYKRTQQDVIANASRLR